MLKPKKHPVKWMFFFYYKRNQTIENTSITKLYTENLIFK